MALNSVCRSVKQLGVLLLNLAGILVHPPATFLQVLSGFPDNSGTHLYSWLRRCTVRIKYLVQYHNRQIPASLEPETIDPKSIALTVRPLHLHVTHFRSVIRLPENTEENNNAFWERMLLVVYLIPLPLSFPC